jgi:hypothetical protein
VTIAINPSNPQNLAAGANLDYYYYSTNGGSTWTQGNLSSSYSVSGDPCVVYDAAGSLYYGHLTYPLDRIVIQKSTNGGKSWSDGAGAGFNPPRHQDKSWLAADMTNSPYRDNLYVAWTQFDSYGSNNRADSSRILFSRSTDHGSTWSAPVRISDLAGDCRDRDSTVEGAVPAIGPNGEVYLTWSGPLGIVFDKSTDGGVTFGKDRFVTSQPGGWDFDIPGISRCNGFPITACDVSNSQHRGTVYVVWSDQRNGVTDTDIFFIRSTDGGLTWGGLKKVNDDGPGSQQFFPWMAIDQKNGNLYSVFYDRRNGTNNATDVFVASSTDGGASFTDFKVSQSSFTPTKGRFFGDYINIAAWNGRIYPIWMRKENDSLSVWTALVTDTLSVLSIGEGEYAANQFRLAQNYPNPFNPTTTIRFSIPHSGHVTLRVYNVLGEEVSTLLDEYLPSGDHTAEWRSGNLASGMYFYRLRSGDLLDTRKLVLLR